MASNVLQWIERKLTDPGRDDTLKLSTDEQTKLSWAKRIRTPAEIPDPYRSFFDGLPAEKTEPFPYAVLSPTYRGFLQPEHEKLIVRIDRNIWVLKAPDGRLTTVCYPLADIVFIETGTILLNAWMTILGKDTSGATRASTWKYNSVTDTLFAPFLESIRATAVGTADGTAADTSAFDALGHSSFKFMNYARRSILPGERALLTILQPEIRRSLPLLSALNITRQVSPAHLTILTDHELIQIREESSWRTTKENQYGNVWRYVPLRKITSLRIEDHGRDLLTLSLNLVGKGSLEAVFQASERGRVLELRSALKTAGIGSSVVEPTAA
ncbi:MAG: hypothetical protein JW929_01510 [Anaerolineales bacterium]|nr:hypothetical protein [Anaerolineales bacterium]